ncbi:tape measure protein [uncultured Paracoccus sp.]|uniref:tape measure protein n=1 Tax=uncultured Paracoccus sp. TaxID=189685 RepID=UPI0025D3003C|nr:tape measure protein [uncultured Paracoccus sp.]
MVDEPDLLISAGFSAAQLERESQKVIAQFRKRGEEAQKAFQDSSGRVTDTQAAKASARELDRLAKAYDPVYRAAKKYEAEVSRLDRALKIGAITKRQYAQRLSAANREMNLASGEAQRFGRAWGGAARVAASGLAMVVAALSGRELIRMTGEWTDLTSRVNLAAGSMEKGEQVMRRVSEMARRTYSDLSQTAEGYLAFSTTLTELGVSTDRQLDFVESLNNALVVSGAKGDTAARVMDALSKAMALGSLQGDNLNTVVASGGRVAQALAESMGVTTAELRKLGSEGKIGRRELLGITQEMEKLRREAGEMPGTIQDGFLLLNNALLEYVGRGDDAVGMSGRIAEALTVIADNFDTVADAGLKLAAVLAAGMLGRSIVGMIANLTNATGVLIRFGAALRAATSMASVGTAISGLSAAAGPLGMVMGGLLAGGVLLYSERAREAEQRSKDMRDELRELGLYTAPETADALDDVAAAADGIGTDDQIARIDRFKKSLEDIKGTGTILSWLIGGDGELDKLIEQVDHFYARFDKADLPLVQQLRDLAKQYQNNQISAAQFADSVALTDLQGAGIEAQKYAAALQDVALRSEAITKQLLFDGVAVEIDSASDALAGLREQVERVAAIQGTTDNIQSQIADLIKKFEDGQSSADDTLAALNEIGSANPNMSNFLAKVATAISALADLRAAALQTATTIAATVAMRPGAGGTSDTSDAQQGAVTDAYVEELRRQNNLSRERQDIEKRTERIMQDAAKAGAALTREQAEQLAIEQAAADARRAEEGRSARSGGGRKGAKKKSEPGLFEDVERDLQNLEREIALIGKSTQEVARARAEWAMLDEAKKRGIPVNEKLFQQIAAQAEKVGELTAELEAGELAHQKFEQAVDGIADAMAGALVAGESLRDGLAQVFKQIASDLMRSGIHDMLSGLIPGGGGKRSVGLLSWLGFAQGGYTGPGGRHEPAGVVHRGEYVMDADSVRRAGGPAAFDAMRRGLRGYANGGYVGAPAMPRLPSIPAMGRAADAGGTSKVQIMLGEGLEARILETAAGQSVQISQAHVRQYDGALDKRVKQINARPRWTR